MPAFYPIDAKRAGILFGSFGFLAFVFSLFFFFFAVFFLLLFVVFGVLGSFLHLLFCRVMWCWFLTLRIVVSADQKCGR